MARTQHNRQQAPKDGGRAGQRRRTRQAHAGRTQVLKLMGYDSLSSVSTRVYLYWSGVIRADEETRIAQLKSAAHWAANDVNDDGGHDEIIVALYERDEWDHDDYVAALEAIEQRQRRQRERGAFRALLEAEADEDASVTKQRPYRAAPAAQYAPVRRVRTGPGLKQFRDPECAERKKARSIYVPGRVRVI